MHHQQNSIPTKKQIHIKYVRTSLTVLELSFARFTS